LCDPAAGLLGSTPLWACLGNHEYNGDATGSIYRQLFSVPFIPGQPKDYPQEHWYSFDYGNCHFTVLDTKYVANEPDPEKRDDWFQEGSQQWNWLEADLEGSSGTWKFVLLHVPPYTHSNAHRYTAEDVTAVRDELAEKLFNKSEYGVNAVFCGHNHFYEHSFKFYDGSSTQGVHYIVTGGGGADEDHNPWWNWDPQNPANPHRHCADPSSPLNYFHYLTVDVPGGAGKPVVKQWRHQDGHPPALIETVTIGEPPPGW
jgi:3',5'-cyclic AMP phosphodiesterase CpdA